MNVLSSSPISMLRFTRSTWMKKVKHINLQRCISVWRALIIVAAISPLIGACKTDSSFELFGFNAQPLTNSPPVEQEVPRANAFDDHYRSPQTEEELRVFDNPLNNSVRAEVLTGNNPADDIKLGKKHYHEQNFGLAERYFRRAVEAAPQNVDAWVGLAASYDKLRRFDLADRAYGQAFSIRGPAPEILNNQGYSYILRGDYKNARIKLAEARAKDPNNQYIQSNIALLEDSIRNAR